jgi:hypothetical protein
VKTDMNSLLFGKTVSTYFMGRLIKTEKFETKRDAALEYWSNVKSFRAVERAIFN